ncbi:ATP-binding cassette domain-containing protein [Azorhizobium caulinodans]|uniref:ATP-binding cassette domain-containing protein n=1 Tax=Azorhizobium caulinodans TaxID=7 RepID=UPI002FBD8BDA
MPTIPPRPEPLFHLDDVAVRIAGRTLLHPLSLRIPKGRVIGLIGHNGSGKSTLLRLLARQLPPSQGEIRFEGVPMPRWRDRAFGRRLAYLPQTLPSAAGLLVRELVALGRYPWHGALGRFGAADRAAVKEALVAVDLTTHAEQPVATLSGGERQRAFLGMLLAQSAGSLLLDEPISALDIAHQVEVLRLVRILALKGGLSVILVLHDVNLAVRFCDEIIALHSGKIIGQDAAGTFMDAARLQQIYGVPMNVIPAEGTAFGVCYPKIASPHEGPNSTSFSAPLN